MARVIRRLWQLLRRNRTEAMHPARLPPVSRMHLQSNHAGDGPGGGMVGRISPVGDLVLVQPDLYVWYGTLDPCTKRIPRIRLPVLLPTVGRRSRHIFQSLTVDPAHAAARK